jgi:hypothetical protein
MNNENRLKRDVEKYPLNRYDFEYKGFKCFMKRLHGINWEGFFECHNLEDYLKRKITVHGGIILRNIENKNFVGFDTMHYGDYTFYPYFYEGEKVYWTYEMTLLELKNLIDQYIILKI